MIEEFELLGITLYVLMLLAWSVCMTTKNFQLLRNTSYIVMTLAGLVFGCFLWSAFA